jgi:hypothetical protein
VKPGPTTAPASSRSECLPQRRRRASRSRIDENGLACFVRDTMSALPRRTPVFSFAFTLVLREPPRADCKPHRHENESSGNGNPHPDRRNVRRTGELNERSHEKKGGDRREECSEPTIAVRVIAAVDRNPQSDRHHDGRSAAGDNQGDGLTVS